MITVNNFWTIRDLLFKDRPGEEPGRRAPAVMAILMGFFASIGAVFTMSETFNIFSFVMLICAFFVSFVSLYKILRGEYAYAASFPLTGTVFMSMSALTIGTGAHDAAWYGIPGAVLLIFLFVDNIKMAALLSICSIIPFMLIGISEVIGLRPNTHGTDIKYVLNVGITNLSIILIVTYFFRRQKKLLTMAHDNEVAQIQANDKLKDLNLHLETRVQERTAQLLQSEKLSAIGQMVAGVAHEVNSPRAAVDHYVTLTERQVDKVLAIQPLQAEVAVPIGKIKREFIPAMSDAITRIGELTNGLLNFTRAEHKEMKSSDMHQIMDSVIVLLRNQLQNRIEIVKSYGDIPPVVCYPGQMNQVFMNILTNAIQAIPGTGTIAITTAVNQDKVEIRIKDTGIGMDEETKKKIFDPFFTTKEVGKGTGLGMSIVWEILQKHGMEISILSEPNKGTEFVLRTEKNL